jgi:hypothetical protein
MKRLEKRRTNSLFLFHDNAPAHLSVVVKEFLENTVWRHWNISHNLMTWLQLILPANSNEISIEGRRICDGIDII